MELSNEIKDLAIALCQAQAEMSGALKDSDNLYYKSKYADLASCIQASRPSLIKYNLSVSQTVDSTSEGYFLVTYLFHSSGQYIKSRFKLYMEKPDMQKLGSAITYARRFGYAAIIGLHQIDDDGESLHDRKPTPKEETPKEETPKDRLIKAQTKNKWNTEQITEAKTRIIKGGKYANARFSVLSKEEQNEIISFFDLYEPSQVL